MRVKKSREEVLKILNREVPVPDTCMGEYDIIIRDLYALADRTYKIYICDETKKEYITKDNTKWYLDDHQGSFEYTPCWPSAKFAALTLLNKILFTVSAGTPRKRLCGTYYSLRSKNLIVSKYLLDKNESTKDKRRIIEVLESRSSFTRWMFW
jgi:hypothetical protein